MNKIHVILPKSMEENVIKKLKEIGIGFTLVENIQGMGQNGMRDGLGFSDAFENILFIIIATSEQFEKVLAEINPIREIAGGLITSEEVKVWK